MVGDQDTDEQDEFLADFASRIFLLDQSVRFVCIANARAELQAIKIRPHLREHLRIIKMEELVKSWVLQIVMFDKYYRLTGALDYYLLKFELLFGAGIPLTRNMTIDDDSKPTHSRVFLFMSFEPGSNVVEIIEDKIIPLIKQKTDYFM